MGYIGPMVGFLTLWLAFSWRDQTDGERAPLIGGAVLAGSNVLVFVAFFGLLLLAFGGVVLAGSMGG